MGEGVVVRGQATALAFRESALSCCIRSLLGLVTPVEDGGMALLAPSGRVSD